jgi:histidinol-phosphate/aromatic aminotransferase/cobyric acid decarboxylase-like protein
MAVEAFGANPDSLRSSPDLEAKELVAALAETRNVDPVRVVLGAGSSELIYRVLPRLMGTGPVLLLDPTYSEYPYLAKVLGLECRTHRLREEDGWRLELSALIDAGRECSATVLVNPNNPTGTALSQDALIELRAAVDRRTRIWVDEAYIDFAGSATSIETLADAGFDVLKSLSKAYALSGVRAAYLVTAADDARRFNALTPPWIIGTAAQAAATAALRDRTYYQRCWEEARARLANFTRHLRAMGYRIHAGHIPAVLCEVPDGGDSSSWATKLRGLGLIVRTPEGMGEVLGDRYVRIALPRAPDMDRTLAILRSAVEV